MKKQFLFILFLFVATIVSYAQDIPLAKEGVLDLRKWDFEKQGIIKLNGEWDFYWEKLYSPIDIPDENEKQKYIIVPNIWSNNKNKESVKFKSYGFATYRLKILLPSEQKNLKINIKELRSAFKVWINGDFCYQTGNVAISKEDHRAGLFSFMKFYISQDNIPFNDTLDIIIQISNYTVPNASGIDFPLTIGTKYEIIRKQNLNYFLGFIAIGIFLIIGFYQLAIFFFRTNERSVLYFSLMSFSILLRTLYNHEFLENFLTNFDFAWFLDNLSVPLFTLFMSLYFYSLYKKEFGKIPLYLFSAYSLFLIVISFFSVEVIDSFLYVYMLNVVLSISYILFIVMPKTYKKNYYGNGWAFFGILFVFLTAISDILNILGVINISYTSTYGFILFTFFQAINIAKRYAYYIRTNEKLNKELKYKNENLEKIVDQRTKTINIQKVDLVQRNEELLHITDEIRAQNEEMKSITEELEQQSVLLQIQTEELKDTNFDLEKLSIVATHADNIVLIFDENLELEWANKAFYEKYNVDTSIYLKEYKFIENSSYEKILDVLNEILDTKKSISYDFCVNDETQLWLQTSVTPIFKGDKLVKIIAIETDISEMKKIQKEISEKKYVIEESIHYARRIQNAILPKFDDYKELFEIFVIYLPKDIVSGDYYWTSFSPNSQKELFIAVADCTGHGVPGAFMSLIGTTLLNEIINQKLILSPEKILDELSKGVKSLLKQNSREDIDGMDVILCKLNIETGLVLFSGAKRPLFYYSSEKQEVIRFISDRLSIGGMHSNLNNKFTLYNLILKKNDIIYLTSDGLIDQNRLDRKKYGTKRLMNKFNEIAQLPVLEQKVLLENSLNEWQLEEPQRDDITIIGIKMI